MRGGHCSVSDHPLYPTLAPPTYTMLPGLVSQLQVSHVTSSEDIIQQEMEITCNMWTNVQCSLSSNSDCLWTRAQEGWGLSGITYLVMTQHCPCVHRAAPSVQVYTVHCTTHWFPMSHVRHRGQRSPIRSDDCEISHTTKHHRTQQKLRLSDKSQM